MKKIIIFVLFSFWIGYAQVGINTTNPNAQLDINSSDKGILIPRVALTAANLETPVTNPSGGPLLESTMVYNTVTAGVGLNEVTPGYHYWNGIRWIKFDTNENGKSKYYTALGNTNVNITNVKTLMPQMQLTFTPKSDVVMIQFSASGSGLSGQRAIYFDLMLNGSLVKGFQTTTEDIGDIGRPIWDINILYPVQVTQGVSQTIRINWAYTGSSALTSHVISPISVGGVFFINAHRVLTVIDPNGGASIETTTPIPVTNSFWSPNGNSGLNSTSNFIGTNDDIDLNFRRNGGIAGGLKPSNTHLGVASLVDLTVGINNVALGNSALNNTNTGDSNVGIGNSSLTTNTQGSFNTGIGSFVNVSSPNLVNATAIGARSFVASNNSLVLGSIIGVNGATSSVNVGLGTTTPQERLHVAGRSLFTDGFSNDNAALLYQNNTDYMFLGPQSGSSANGAAMALFGSTNTSSGNANGVDLNVPNGLVRMNHTNGSFSFGANSTNGYNGLFEVNDIGLTIGHNSASRAIVFSPNNIEQMRLTPNGRVGIGTTTPDATLEVNGTNVITSPTLEGNLFVNSNDPQNIDIGGSIALGGSINAASSLSRVFGTIEGRKANNAENNTAGYLLFKTNSGSLLTLSERMRITNAGDVGIGTATPGGQFELSLNEGRKPGTTTWTVVSDARLKNVLGIYTKGLTEILQLNPILYKYKNGGGRIFEEEVLNTSFAGFIAQEVKPLFPEAVGTDTDGYLNFDIHAILIASINAIKELHQKNITLQNLITEQQQEISRLKLLEEKMQALIKRMETIESSNR